MPRLFADPQPPCRSGVGISITSDAAGDGISGDWSFSYTPMFERAPPVEVDLFT